MLRDRPVRLAISLIDNPCTTPIALTSAHSCTPTTSTSRSRSPIKTRLGLPPDVSHHRPPRVRFPPARGGQYSAGANNIDGVSTRKVERLVDYRASAASARSRRRGCATNLDEQVTCFRSSGLEGRRPRPSWSPRWSVSASRGCPLEGVGDRLCGARPALRSDRRRPRRSGRALSGATSPEDCKPAASRGREAVGVRPTQVSRTRSARSYAVRGGVTGPKVGTQRIAGVSPLLATVDTNGMGVRESLQQLGRDWSGRLPAEIWAYFGNSADG